MDVIVRGELVTPLPKRDYGSVRCWHLVYVFESRYRRTVESNDGYRFTERHDYGPLRSAKLLLPMNDGKTASKTLSGWSLAEMKFPAASEGIGVVSPRKLASLLLASEDRHFAERPESQGAVETDALSGRSVRFVYDRRTGLQSVEAIGWHPTNEQMEFLSIRTAPIEWWATSLRGDAGWLQPPRRHNQCHIGRPGEWAIDRGTDRHRSGVSVYRDPPRTPIAFVCR